MKMTPEYTVEVTEKCNYIFSVNAQTMEIIEFKGVHCWVDAMARNMNNNVQGFKDRVNTMHGEVSPHNTDFASTENGWVRTSDGRIYTPAEKRQSRLKYNWSTMEGSLTEWYHTHPMGAMLPNISDLRALAQQYRNGRITDVENFSYGVISSYGCASLVITSEDAFKKFAEKIKTEEGMKEIDEFYMSYHQSTLLKYFDSYLSMKLYIEFLSKSASGLHLIYRDYDYSNTQWNDWTVKGVESNHIIDNPCK